MGFNIRILTLWNFLLLGSGQSAGFLTPSLSFQSIPVGVGALVRDDWYIKLIRTWDGDTLASSAMTTAHHIN